MTFLVPILLHLVMQINHQIFPLCLTSYHSTPEILFPLFLLLHLLIQSLLSELSFLINPPQPPQSPPLCSILTLRESALHPQPGPLMLYSLGLLEPSAFRLLPSVPCTDMSTSHKILFLAYFTYLTPFHVVASFPLTSNNTHVWINSTSLAFLSQILESH